MDKCKKILDVIRRAETFLILTHVRPDGDAISSALAMRELIVGFGKNAENIDVFIPHVSKDLSFVDVNNVITSNCARENHDLVIVVDCSDAQRVEGRELLEGVSPKQCILVDHHEASGIPVKTDYSIVDTSAPSCTCIMHREFSAYVREQERNLFDMFIAIGIMSDTIGLTLNVTDECRAILSACQRSGVDIQEIIQQLKRVDIRTQTLAKEAIERLSFYKGIGCSYILQADLLHDERSLKTVNHKAIIQQILDTVSCSTLILVIENDKHQFKGSMRTSVSDVDLNTICAEMVASNRFMQGGGHSNSAGFIMTVPDTGVATLESIFEFLTSAIVGA